MNFTSYFIKNMNNLIPSNIENEVLLNNYTLKSEAINKYNYLSDIYLKIRKSYLEKEISNEDYLYLATLPKEKLKEINDFEFFNPNTTLFPLFSHFLIKNKDLFKENISIEIFKEKVMSELKNSNENKYIDYYSYKKNLISSKRSHFLNCLKRVLFLKD